MTSSEAPVHTGGCQCGAVRYALTTDDLNPSICHCRMCQKAFGAFYAPLAGVNRQCFKLTRGTLSVFRSSDAAERGFCSQCGTPLTFRYLDRDEIDVSIGSLDQPQRVKPEKQFGIEGRLSWLNDLAALPGRSTAEGAGPRKLELIRTTSRQHPDHDTETWPPPAKS